MKISKNELQITYTRKLVGIWIAGDVRVVIKRQEKLNPLGLVAYML